MNIAILGPGGISDDQHAPAVRLHEDTQLWSVLSRSQARADAFSLKHDLKSNSPGYTNLKSLIADENLDAVIIASPDRLHAQQVIQCAEAGKHILLEKPMATSLEECDQMIAACQANSVHLALAYHLRWHAGHRMAKQHVQNGLLGKLRHMRVHWTFAAPDGSNWRSSPKAGRWWSLAANGTHCLDQIRWFMCPTEGEINEVRCLISRSKFSSAHDESAILALGFESGATAEICVSVQFASKSRIEIYGDNGDIRMEDTMGRHGGGSVFANGESVDFPVVNPFLGELNNFVETAQQNRLPEVDALEGRRNVQLLLQAIAASGQDAYIPS